MNWKLKWDILTPRSPKVFSLYQTGKPMGRKRKYLSKKKINRLMHEWNLNLWPIWWDFTVISIASLTMFDLKIIYIFLPSRMDHPKKVLPHLWNYCIGQALNFAHLCEFISLLPATFSLINTAALSVDSDSLIQN